MMPTRYGMQSKNAIEYLSAGVRKAFENKSGLLSRLEHSEKICNLVDVYIRPEMELIRPDYSKNIKNLMRRMQMHIENHLEKDDELCFDDYLEEVQKIKDVSKASIEKKINDKTNAIVNKIKVMYLKDIEASYLENRGSCSSSSEDSLKEKPSGDDDDSDESDPESESVIDYRNKEIVKQNLKSWIRFSPVHNVKIDDIINACESYALYYFKNKKEDIYDIITRKESALTLHFSPTERLEYHEWSKYKNQMTTLIKECIVEAFEPMKKFIEYESREEIRESVMSDTKTKLNVEYLKHFTMTCPMKIQDGYFPDVIEE